MSTLLVASSGGHLKELHQLRDRVRGVSGPFRWVTFDTPQSRSLLRDEDCDTGQGFLFARPLDAPATEAFLQGATKQTAPAVAPAPPVAPALTPAPQLG